MSRQRRIEAYEESTGLRYSDGDPTKKRRQTGLLVTIDHESPIQKHAGVAVSSGAREEALLAYFFLNFSEHVPFTASHWAEFRRHLAQELRENDSVQLLLSVMREDIFDLIDRNFNHYEAIVKVVERWSFAENL